MVQTMLIKEEHATLSIIGAATGLILMILTILIISLILCGKQVLEAILLVLVIQRCASCSI